MANIQTHGVGKLVHRATAAFREGRSLRRGQVSYGPWRVELHGGTGKLFHYGTQMLEWKYKDYHGNVEITGTWTGWGSTSDQQGVNAALYALGSPMRYSRDKRGGGPRINPRRRRNASVTRVLAVRAVSPTVPMWMR